MAITAGWVDATPFRAHVRFLMGVGAISSSDLATLAEISARAIDHLLHGRSGRVVRRISTEMARRLITITADDVRGLPWRLVPTERARAQLVHLRRTGRTDSEIAVMVGVSATDLANLDGPVAHCSELTSLRLATAARALRGEEEPRRRSTAAPMAA